MQLSWLKKAPIIDFNEEAISLEAPGMVKEARELSQIAPNIVIKIPLVKEGLKAVRELSRNNHE